MRDDSPEGFEAVLSDHLDRLQPAGGMEFGMVRRWSLPTGVSAASGCSLVGSMSPVELFDGKQTGFPPDCTDPDVE